MSKTYKDKPEKYRPKDKYKKPKVKRFVSSKGRKSQKILDEMEC